MLWVFQVFWWLFQSEVKKIILVKSSLCEVRFNPHESRLNHQSDCLLLDFKILSAEQMGPFDRHIFSFSPHKSFLIYMDMENPW